MKRHRRSNSKDVILFGDHVSKDTKTALLKTLGLHVLPEDVIGVQLTPVGPAISPEEAAAQLDHIGVDDRVAEAKSACAERRARRLNET